ncbi:MAG: thioredoxin domain-containing protein [Candidatus Aenigmarchaeota archaeon]|nr:thioredoxin domain-containing protein [Candidatus Aenigmarchaeota archaeon]
MTEDAKKSDDSIKISKSTLKWLGIVCVAFIAGITLGTITATSGISGNAVAQPQPQPSGDWSFVAADPAIGPVDAKVTVVEFADFQCPYCGIAYGKDIGGAQYDKMRGTATKITDEYAKQGKIRFVYHVMAFLGQESIDSANAAFCAREIGGDEAFFKMHDKLFDKQSGENEGAFSKDNLKTYAAEAGFNTTAMMDCISSGKYDSVVQQSNSLSNGVGVQGTPTYALNNAVVPNGAIYATLKSAVDAALAK